MMFSANSVNSRKTEVMFSLCIRNAIARTLFSFAIDCCLQTFTFLVYYKDLRFYLFLYLDKIVLRLCLIFCLILQFLAKYLGNLNKLFLSKIIFVQRLSLLIFSCYHSNSACVPHQANLNNLQNTIVKITLYLTYLDTAMKLQPSQKVSN